MPCLLDEMRQEDFRRGQGDVVRQVHGLVTAITLQGLAVTSIKDNGEAAGGALRQERFSQGLHVLHVFRLFVPGGDACFNPFCPL